MDEILRTLVGSIAEAGSNKTLTTAKIREWLAGYLSRFEQEVDKFPEIASKPHFDLIMADFDYKKDALFIVAVFHSDFVSFVAGRGDSAKVREYAETDFPDNPLEVIPDLKRLFNPVSHPVKISHEELVSWLNENEI